jgi:hypothetical protein
MARAQEQLRSGDLRQERVEISLVFWIAINLQKHSFLIAAILMEANASNSTIFQQQIRTNAAG